jgi:formylglycine-generating enzyme required for sulfatase activity
MGCSADDRRCDGDEYPAHAVTISRPFDLMSTEVTVGMLFSADRPIPEQPEWSASFDQPAVAINWEEARAVCEALGGRLPTEAEWEYAARGGIEGAVFPWGSEAPSYDDGDATGAAFEGGGGRPVGTFGPNGYGLYDMAGNVWEWVEDIYGAYPNEAVMDPIGPDTGLVHIVRGGSYGDDSSYLRVANRNPAQPDGVHVNVGVRCARD